MLATKKLGFLKIYQTANCSKVTPRGVFHQLMPYSWNCLFFQWNLRLLLNRQYPGCWVCRFHIYPGEIPAAGFLRIKNRCLFPSMDGFPGRGRCKIRLFPGGQITLCARTGCSLNIMANALGLDVDELGRFQAAKPAVINNMCTVFCRIKGDWIACPEHG